MRHFRKFPVEYQMDAKDCGPATLKMIAKYYGRYYSLQFLRDKCGITKEGVSLFDISSAAENIGLRTAAVKCSVLDLISRIPLPCIVHWENNHFIVVYRANRNYIWVADPQKGRIKYDIQKFSEGWLRRNEKVGILLALEPTSSFALTEKERTLRNGSIWDLLGYFLPYKHHFALIALIMLLATLLQAILPFISKSVIDVGISSSDVTFIKLILVGNVCILLSIMAFNVIRD